MIGKEVCGKISDVFELSLKWLFGLTLVLAPNPKIKYCLNSKYFEPSLSPYPEFGKKLELPLKLELQTFQQTTGFDPTLYSLHFSNYSNIKYFLQDEMRTLLFS